MNVFLSLLFFTLAQIGFYIYVVISRNYDINNWKILLIPIILFPILYIGNLFISGAHMLASKANISTAVSGISYIGIGGLVFIAGHALYYKQNIDLKMILGTALVIGGIFLINWK